MLEFLILGPLEVLAEGRTIELGGARRRSVLAILLLHRGETVSVDRIVDLMWGERAPATAVKTVQVYVSHLRRALADDVIVSSRGGYALAIEAGQVDSLRFERLAGEGRAALADGDPARAAELLRSALALWRGPALGELAHERFAQDDAARLEQLRLTSTEARIEADLRLGRHDDLVPELERLVAEHPLRENLRAQNMLALYRAGRQADALQSYRDGRRTLVDELGLEPGRELRELERAILAQDPALNRPRRPSRPPPGGRRLGLALVAAGAALALAVTAVVVAVTARGNDAVVVLPDSVAVIDPAEDRVLASVPVGAGPETVAAGERYIWVANVADGTVSQIDIATRRAQAAIVTDDSVAGLAVGAGSAWIADGSRGRAVRLDADVGAVADVVRFPAASSGIRSGTPSAAALGRNSLWVANAALAAVFEIDTASRRVRARVDVGNNPTGIAIGEGAVWVADSTDNTVSRIAPAGAGAITDTIPLGNGSGPIAAGEAAIWVANSHDGTVSRINPSTRAVEAVIAVGRLPSGLAVGAGAVWVANSLSGTVSRIDPRTNQVAKTIQVGGAPRSVAVADGRIWVSVQDTPPRPGAAGGPAAARVLLNEDPGTTNPAGLLDEQLLHATCARLMTYAGLGGSVGATLVPELAATPPAVSGHARVHTFRIRAGYRFSPPSGREVTAAAFERAIERTLHPRTRSFGSSLLDDVTGAPAYRAGRARRITGVAARGNRLKITLTRPSPTLPARMATFHFCAVPPNTPVRPRGLERVASAGPYYVAAAARRRSLLLRRNPGYPGPRARPLEEIEVTIGTPPARAVADVEAGRADYTPLVPPDAQARLMARYGPGSRAAASGRQRYFAGPAPGVQGLLLNPRRPLFARAAMRRAVNYAINRRALAGRPIPQALAALPTDQHIPPGWPGFRDAAIYPLGGPDLVTARRLAGRERRSGVLYTCNAAECVEHAEIVRSNLAAIGIELEIRRFSFAHLFARVQDPDEPFDLSLWGWAGETPDPSEFMDTMFNNAAASRLLAGTRLGRRLRVVSRLDGAARTSAYSTVDRDIAALAAPFAPYLSALRTDFFSGRVGCQVAHPLYGVDLAALCLRDSSATSRAESEPDGETFAAEALSDARPRLGRRRR